MTSVVKKILRGHERVETDRIIAFRSHWGYQSEYCNPAKGNEKGGVEGQGGVKVKTNWDAGRGSPGQRVRGVVGPSQIVISHGGRHVAKHERCYGRGHQILNLEHYLDVLEKKPGAMSGSTPLQQWRQAGRWPACLDRIWEQLEARHGKSQGTREMIALVRAGLANGWQRLIGAVEEALRIGVT